MDLFNTEEALQLWTNALIAEAKLNLSKKDKVVSGKLSDSITSREIVNADGSLTSTIEMEAYGQFIDKGVSGIKKKYNTPYSYKLKMPPTKSLDNWVVRRNIAPRDAKGRFIPRKSVLFAIARGIYNNGIKPSLFLTSAFEKLRADLPFELTEGFRKDAKEKLKAELKFTLKN